MIPRQHLRRDDFRFELRPWDFPCVPALYEAAIESRKEISPWMAWIHAGYSLQEAENWIAHAVTSWNTESEYHFVICDREDGSLAGACGLNKISRQDRMANLGYWVRTSRTRRAAATQAALLLKEFGLTILKFNRLEIVVAEGNHASRRVAEKTGALYEGLQRCRIRVVDQVFDAHMYAFV